MDKARVRAALSRVNINLERGLSRVYRELGLRWDHQGKLRSGNMAKLAAQEFFYTTGDEWADSVRFEVKVNGERRWYETSTANLLSFQTIDFKNRQAFIVNKLRELEERGIISYETQDLSGISLPDDRMVAPERFLSWPHDTFSNYPHPEHTPGDMPIPRRPKPVYCTRKVWDSREFTDEQFVREYETLWTAIVELHRAANCNVSWSPAIVCAQSPVKHMNDNIRSLLVQSKSSDSAIEALLRTAHKPIMGAVLRSSTDNAIDSCIEFRTGHPTWQGSLTRQRSSFWNHSSNDYDIATTYANCAVDFAELVMLAQFLSGMKPQALLHSCCQYHNWAIQSAFSTLRLPKYSDLLVYQQRMDEEAQARKDKAVANGANAAAAIAYAIGGDSATTKSVSGATVATMELAMAALGATGVLGAVLLFAMVGLVAWSLSSGGPREFPEREPVRDRPLSDAMNTNIHYGRTIEGAIRTTPVLRVE